MSRKSGAAFLAMLAACSACTKKTADDPSGLQLARELVAKATHGKSKVLGAYRESPSLDAVILDSGGKKSVAWVLTDRKLLIIGSLFDAAGRDISSQADDFIPVDAGVMLSRAERAHGFTEGTRGPLIYVFFDPNCSYCSRFYRDTRSFIASNSIRIRWIPVAFLKPDSVGKAEAILSAKNPVAALASHEATFDEDTETGGISPLTAGNPGIREFIHANTESLLKGNDKIGTPSIVYVDKEGKPVLQVGLPSKISKIIGLAKE